MKKIFLAAGLAAGMWACNNETKDTTTTVTDSTTNTTNNNANATVYRPAEGDVTYKGGKVLVWRNNNWVETDEDVTLDNGVIVRKDGRVVKNGEEVELEDGGVVDKSGRFFDKAGNVVEDGWDGLKKGAKEAKEGVKKGYNEAKEEVKDVFKDDDKKNQ